MTRLHGAELSPFRAATSWAASFFLFIMLWPGAAVPQTVTTCPGLPGKYVILKNQPYALCAGAQSVNFDKVTYANVRFSTETALAYNKIIHFRQLNRKGILLLLTKELPRAVI